MSFRLNADEALRAGLRRATAEEFASAAAGLKGPSEHWQTAVHEARKSLKRVRSMFRMIREPLGERRYRAETDRVRTISTLLAPYRDADALLELMDELHAHHAELLDGEAFERAREALRTRRGATYAAGEGFAPVAEQVVGQLDAAQRAVASLPVPASWRRARQELRESYRRARAEGRRAAKKGTVDAHHDWRKRVKDLYYQCELFRDTRIGPSKHKRQALDVLGALLGFHHDLCIFDELLDDADVFPDRGHARHVQELVRAQCRRAEVQAGELRKQLFSSSSKGFVRVER
jgi:CHAD domain-containing protein